MKLFFQNSVNLFFKRGNISYDYPPDFLWIDCKIVMDKNILEPDDLALGNVRIILLRCFRDTSCRFAQYLEMVYYPDLYEFTGFKRMFTPSSIFLNLAASAISAKRSMSSLKGERPPQESGFAPGPGEG